ncbi:mechanosensitive ion channel [uncultured Tessaracoccus sp.]|uniref:mechanosensitive ion channel n=1 Tax=uncultured Tessaracoccus sp. TaxID=905023 RepID=UPI00263905C3|nr:mechanosensitive ion channel [uncultured Tessaracoccus sp.]
MDSLNIDWGSLLLNIVAAIVILLATWIIASLVKSALSKWLVKIPFLQRSEDGGRGLAGSLATIVSLLIWLLGLTAVLTLFSLDSVLSPLQGLLNGFMQAVPGVVGAGLIFFIGYVLAKVVRQILVTALHAAHFDERVANFGSDAKRVSDAPINRSATQPAQAPQGQPYPQQGQPQQGQHQQMAAPQQRPAQQRSSITDIIGNVVFALIVVVVSIAALDVLGIPALSGPATRMLSLFLDALPLIIGAGILLAVGVVIANFIVNILEPILEGLNLDEKLEGLGIERGSVNSVKVITTIVRVGIILFFAVAAANLLNFAAITRILDNILSLGGRILFGAAVILAGVFIANLLAKIVSGTASHIIRVATIVLFSAMGLQFMGIADSIINLAFAALVVGGAAAAALAFGLGGRDAAARQLAKLEAKSDEVTPTAQ